MNFDFSKFTEMPWYVAVIMMIFTAILSFVTTRMTSKDKVQRDLISQTVHRQQQLDERTTKLIDELQEEISTLRRELVLTREEMNEERKRNTSLESKMSELQKENKDLRHENAVLKELVNELQEQLKTLRGE